MDYELSNCKLKISQCSGVEDMKIERPMKVKIEVPNLEALVAAIHDAFSTDYVNVEYVSQLLGNYKSCPKDWKKYAKFDRFRYTRNLVDAGNGSFNLMVLCWGPGHASPIHDHADSHCFMKMLSGSLEEVRCDWPEKSKPESLRSLPNSTEGDSILDQCPYEDSAYYESQGMVELGRSRLDQNDVCYINDTLGLHRVENPSHTDNAVSLHLYCPPFDSCRIFDARTGKSTKVHTTFWSMYGKKQKTIENKSPSAS